MVQQSFKTELKSKRSDTERSTGRGGLNQSILESKFKTELKPVFRKGFSTVYRMRIPDEIAERKDVQKTKCIRLKLLKPSLEGRALPQEDFTVKMSGKNILIPMAIIVSKGLDKLKAPTTVTVEFLGPASHVERVSPPAGRGSPNQSILESKRSSNTSCTTQGRPTQSVAPPKIADDVSRLWSEVENIQGKLKGLDERLEEHITTTKPSPEPPPPEHVTESKAPAVPPPAPPKEAPTQTAPDKQGPAPAPPEERAIPVETSKPPVVTPPLPADSQERLVSINDKPPKYEVVRVDDESTKPTTSPPGEVKSTVTPSPKPEEKKIRFEKDGEYVSIYLGNEQISTVSIMKTVSGPVFSCGTCDWEAIKKGREPSTASCEHVEMVKKFLSSLG